MRKRSARLPEPAITVPGSAGALAFCAACGGAPAKALGSKSSGGTVRLDCHLISNVPLVRSLKSCNDRARRPPLRSHLLEVVVRPRAGTLRSGKVPDSVSTWLRPARSTFLRRLENAPSQDRASAEGDPVQGIVLPACHQDAGGQGSKSAVINAPACASLRIRVAFASVLTCLS